MCFIYKWVMMKKFILSCFILCFIAIIAGCTNIFQWKYDYLVLVNKQHKLPADWESKVELVEVKNAFDEDIKVEKEAYEQYLKLRDALLEEGVDIELDSVYRSVSRQEELWAEFEEEYGIDYTKKYVAVPWYSEHHTALAIDICIKKDWELIYENDDMIAEKEIFDKIHNKLADYGFILRYLEWKEDITWYGYEPRHLRYIWDVDAAKEIMEKWLTLEEYLWEVPEDTLIDWSKTAFLDWVYSQNTNIKDIRELPIDYDTKQAIDDDVIIVPDNYDRLIESFQYTEPLRNDNKFKASFTRFAQNTVEWDLVLYDIFYNTDNHTIYLITDFTRDEFSAKEDRIIDVKEFEHIWEYEHNWIKYRVLYNWELNDETFQSENAFVLANLW